MLVTYFPRPQSLTDPLLQPLDNLHRHLVMIGWNIRNLYPGTFQQLKSNILLLVGSPTKLA